MAPRKPPTRKTLLQRTPLAEWIAAGLGLVLTVSMLGILIWEGLIERPGPPDLTVRAEAVKPVEAGFALPIVVRNDSYETAAGVDVVGTLSAGGKVVEERHTSFSYVPGRGETRGGLVFRHNPRDLEVEVRAEGYEAP